MASPLDQAVPTAVRRFFTISQEERLRIAACKQGSDEWLDSRRFRLSGTRVPAILGLLDHLYPNAFVTTMIALLYGKQPHVKSFAMRRGNRMEPKVHARMLEYLLAQPGVVAVETREYGFWVGEEDPLFGGSIDAMLIITYDDGRREVRVAEYKAPMRAMYTERVPLEYRMQMHNNVYCMKEELARVAAAVGGTVNTTSLFGALWRDDVLQVDEVPYDQEWWVTTYVQRAVHVYCERIWPLVQRVLAGELHYPYLDVPPPAITVASEEFTAEALETFFLLDDDASAARVEAEEAGSKSDDEEEEEEDRDEEAEGATVLTPFDPDVFTFYL